MTVKRKVTGGRGDLIGRPYQIYALLLLLLCAGMAVLSQEEERVWQVFLRRDVDASGIDQLVFLDVLTGDEVEVEVVGERYTLVEQSVMYFDLSTRRVMLASPDGDTRPHPFIQPGLLTRRVDWIVSGDGSTLAWTLTEGDPAALTTITTVASIDGTSPHQVLQDGPRNGIRAMPVAFSGDNSLLYMDYQPDMIGDFTPFRQYAGLFSVDVKDNSVAYLPGEPGCFCGAGIGEGWFLRLALTNDLSGFDVKVVNLTTQAEFLIPALRLSNYTQAGGIVVSRDGTRAVYALAQIRDFGQPTQSTETVFMLVNLLDFTQTTLTQPVQTFVRPLAFTDDNTAVLFTSPEEDGTWKVNIGDGRLNKVASATYLGELG